MNVSETSVSFFNTWITLILTIADFYRMSWSCQLIFLFGEFPLSNSSSKMCERWYWPSSRFKVMPPRFLISIASLTHLVYLFVQSWWTYSNTVFNLWKYLSPKYPQCHLSDRLEMVRVKSKNIIKIALLLLQMVIKSSSIADRVLGDDHGWMARGLTWMLIVMYH